MSDEHLTKLYSPSQWVPGRTGDEVIQEFYKSTLEALKEVTDDESIVKNCDIPYGTGENQKVNVFGDVNENLLILIHGGYWVSLDRNTILHPVRTAIDAGYGVASIGYGLASKSYSLSRTVDDCVRGVRHVLAKFANAKTVVIAGHSAGAHLAFHAATRCRDRRIKGLALFAGVYTLDELVDTDIGKEANLTPDEAARNSCDFSALDGLETMRTKIFIGTNECPKLVEQNRKLADARKEVELEEIPDATHFTIISDLMKPGTRINTTFANFLRLF
ncbi:unnamed protein product [Caenorhabditis bovis]|uniref:Alpha/beta hydrolase fold-3 domain-containing protein n=1 Tax=Caenorhabditis bovis TaxID=2654633 RepID=A0A8S1F4E8_9PELO|nr:unnamed protein product [Caenorhabditis bovis]